MTTLLVIGLIALVVGIARTSGDLSESMAAAERVFGEIEVALPADDRVVDVSASGDRLSVRVADADGNERVIVFDLTTGQRLGVVRLVPGP